MVNLYCTICQAAHAEKLGASGIGILPNMFTVPNDTDHLAQWIKHVAGAAPKTPAVYYHIPVCTKVTCERITPYEKPKEDIMTSCSATTRPVAQSSGTGAELCGGQVHLEGLRRGRKLPQAQEAERKALPLLLRQR